MTTQEELDERYGRAASRGRRRTIWIIIAAIGVAFFGTLAWVTVSSTVNAVNFDGTGHEIVDERTVNVLFQVTPPPGRSFACALQALDEEFGIVGWRVVEYPASDGAARAYQEAIPTVALATTGLVQSCWVT